MSETKHTPGPWARLLGAAKEAQDLIASEHYNGTAGAWDNDDAMQVYEDIECALADIAEAGADADGLPDLLAACEEALAWAETDGLKERLGAAIAKAKGRRP